MEFSFTLIYAQAHVVLCQLSGCISLRFSTMQFNCILLQFSNRLLNSRHPDLCTIFLVNSALVIYMNRTFTSMCTPNSWIFHSLIKCVILCECTIATAFDYVFTDIFYKCTKKKLPTTTSNLWRIHERLKFNRCIL